MYRLAFIPSKFRLGEEPEPFVFGVDHRQTPWVLRDVTAEVITAGTTARVEAEQHRKNALAKAMEKLTTEVLRLDEADTPMNRGAAEAFLKAAGLTRKAARALLDQGTRATEAAGVSNEETERAPRHSSEKPRPAFPPSPLWGKSLVPRRRKYPAKKPHQ